MKTNSMKLGIWILVLLMAAIACGGGSSSEVPTDQIASDVDESSSVEAISTTVPTVPPQPTETVNPNLLSAGTYIVGSDIQPGLYIGQAGIGLFDSCYWERLSDLSGEFSAILANDNSEGQFYIEVRDTDFALEVSCNVLYLETVPVPALEFPLEIGVGTYLVGIDIQPGTYRGEAGADITESCYWERLKHLSGDLSAIIANDNAQGQFYVQISSSDYAFSTHCDLSRVGD